MLQSNKGPHGLFAAPTGHYPLSVIHLLANLGGFPLQCLQFLSFQNGENQRWP